ncbi:MAG: LysM peptidoglycan-binding domain-containing protein [Iphinoe sp. HA4291-MV1]|jgi:nucleoid-associated protein YgaU|nr:LysM peptidoglycan-binding domain-containing protein [Iphinoe sp. HA4291-MV1]
MVLGGATSQSVAKLEITPQSPSALKPIKVSFNPNSYSITKTVIWNTANNSTGEKTESEELLNAPTLRFGGGASRELTFSELFFDVTEPINGVKIDDVRKKTNELVALTRIERATKKPPVCLVTWGNAPSGSDFPFKGVVTSLTQTFTLFKRDGTPVRAKLSVTFREYLKPLDDQRQTDPELTTHIVKRGDTLSSIAAQLYGDPKRWRIIAEANHLDDPRHLDIGTLLSIPELI